MPPSPIFQTTRPWTELDRLHGNLAKENCHPSSLARETGGLRRKTRGFQASLDRGTESYRFSTGIRSPRSRYDCRFPLGRRVSADRHAASLRGDATASEFRTSLTTGSTRSRAFAANPAGDGTSPQSDIIPFEFLIRVKRRQRLRKSNSFQLQQLLLLRDIQESIRDRTVEIGKQTVNGKLSPEHWLEVNELANQQKELLESLRTLFGSSTHE